LCPNGSYIKTNTEIVLYSNTTIVNKIQKYFTGLICNKFNIWNSSITKMSSENKTYQYSKNDIFGNTNKIIKSAMKHNSIYYIPAKKKSDISIYNEPLDSFNTIIIHHDCISITYDNYRMIYNITQDDLESINIFEIYELNDLSDKLFDEYIFDVSKCKSTININRLYDRDYIQLLIFEYAKLNMLYKHNLQKNQKLDDLLCKSTFIRTIIMRYYNCLNILITKWNNKYDHKINPQILSDIKFYT